MKASNLHLRWNGQIFVFLTSACLMCPHLEHKAYFWEDQEKIWGAGEIKNTLPCPPRAVTGEHQPHGLGETQHYESLGAAFQGTAQGRSLPRGTALIMGWGGEAFWDCVRLLTGRNLKWGNGANMVVWGGTSMGKKQIRAVCLLIKLHF